MAVASSRFLSAREQHPSVVKEEDALMMTNVFFRFVDGKTYCLQVNPYQETIGALKTRLAQKAAAVASSSHNNQGRYSSFTTDTVWIWNAKVLDDDDSYLSDYHYINNNTSTIHVFPRARGGCFMISLTVLCTIFMAVVGSTCTCGASLLLVPLLLPLLFILPLFCL